MTGVQTCALPICFPVTIHIEGLEVTCPDLDNLYILVKDKNELESQCRRIFAEMSELSPDSLDLQFIFN